MIRISLRMLAFFALLALVLFVIAYFWGGDATASERSQDRTAEWLARSCIGESGFDAYKTGECESIMWVYRKGAMQQGRSVLLQARLYSSAIKRGKHHKRPWIFHLSRKGIKPRGWGNGAKWANHKDRWLKTLELANLFIQGKVEDPLPTAEHYGCKTDTNKLNPKVWRRIKVSSEYENLFYERRPRR
jgi:hypothetical protein